MRQFYYKQIKGYLRWKIFLAIQVGYGTELNMLNKVIRNLKMICHCINFISKHVHLIIHFETLK